MAKNLEQLFVVQPLILVLNTLTHEKLRENSNSQNIR